MKDWNGNKKSVFAALGASNHSKQERETMDYYATEPKAIDLLASKSDIPHRVWECACGGGSLSERLKERGHEVVSTDIIDRGYEGFDGVCDFLSRLFHPRIEGDYAIVTQLCGLARAMPKARSSESRRDARIHLAESRRAWTKVKAHFWALPSVSKVKTATAGLIRPASLPLGLGRPPVWRGCSNPEDDCAGEPWPLGEDIPADAAALRLPVHRPNPLRQERGIWLSPTSVTTRQCSNTFGIALAAPSVDDARKNLGAGAQAYAWFVWQKGWRGRTTLDWI